MKYDNNNNMYYVKLWITEHDRDQGYSEEYYKDFNNLKDAIKDLRTYFYDGNCVCVEIYDSNDILQYSCDKESEEFYTGTYNIVKVDEKLLGKYIDCWIYQKEFPINNRLLYCENSDGIFTAIDNRSGYCFVENFDDEEKTFMWLLDVYEKDEMEI